MGVISLFGAGRVEDTYNLIGHALEVVLDCAAKVSGYSKENICEQASLTLLGKSSIKVALDIDWNDDIQKNNALNQLISEVFSLKYWINEKLSKVKNAPPLKEALELLERVIAQNIEPDPDGSGSKIIEGVAKDRLISIHDKDMRHGRKSKSKTINGYKRHIAKDIDSGLIYAAAVRPANEPEHLISSELRKDVERQGVVDELHIDRGYLASDWAIHMDLLNKPVFSKPWRSSGKKFYSKEEFSIDLVSNTVKCPQGIRANIKSNSAKFTSTNCDSCPMKAKCTESKNGRTISIHENEELLIKLRQMANTSEGRKQLRERVTVEHSLAHICSRQGRRARYSGINKNNLDLRRVAAINNLHTLMRFPQFNLKSAA